MKRKQTDNQTRVNGFYVNELIRGFWGEHNEGKRLLKKMGLPSDRLPFSVAVFLQKQHVFWTDKLGNRVTISFKLKDNQLECFGTYLVPKDQKMFNLEQRKNPKAEKFYRKQKSIRLFREWGSHEDIDIIAHLESEAIGDCCRECCKKCIEE